MNHKMCQKNNYFLQQMLHVEACLCFSENVCMYGKSHSYEETNSIVILFQIV